MANAIRFNLPEADRMPDPVTGSGEFSVFASALGQDGVPFVLHMADPPGKTRARHHHRADVLYVYTQGEHRIENEGVYRAGDVRWVRAGHSYGPETTGPEGGAWWIVTYGDPVPVESEVSAEGEAAIAPPGELPRFEAPHDWPAIDRAVRDVGGAIVEGFVEPALAARLDGDLDAYLDKHSGAGAPDSGSGIYDMFLGKRTVRLHGLAGKMDSAAGLIGDPRLIAWAQRALSKNAASILLNAGEVIQIGPGEPAQYLHRDTDSWPSLPVGAGPFLVNAILALDDFNLDNGATHVVPGSHLWNAARKAKQHEVTRATMRRGDALMFRGDIIHGGGANVSAMRRRAISISYCAGWLRPVENSFLNVPVERARRLPPEVSALLGYAKHDATARGGGMLGLFDNGDPVKALEAQR